MSVIRRLPSYYRVLTKLSEQSVDKISSTKLAQIMNVTASQVRQDLNCFGGFGQQGYGYSVNQLKNEIAKILGLNNVHKAVLIGAGFDIIPEKVGHKINGAKVMHDTELEAFCGKNKIDAAFLCIPDPAVENVLEILYSCGVRSYWNFSHYDIAAKYSDTVVENVHLSDNLMTLCYRMNNNNNNY